MMQTMTAEPFTDVFMRIMHLIEDHAQQADIPVRFAASKLAEGDELILEKLGAGSE